MLLLPQRSTTAVTPDFRWHGRSRVEPEIGAPPPAPAVVLAIISSMLRRHRGESSASALAARGHLAFDQHARVKNIGGAVAGVDRAPPRAKGCSRT